MADPVENKPKLGELPSLLSDIKDVVFERIKNPFLASFSFFWIIWNWKIPFYLFLSDDNIEMKFTVVSKVYASFGNTFLFPFISAVLYFYLKDHFFNYFESTSNDAFLERKKTENIKTIELIKLEKDKVDVLNELKDAQDKNKLKERITKLNEDLNKVNTLNKNLTDEISRLNIEKERLFSLVNQNTDLDLNDSRIQYIKEKLKNHRNLLNYGKNLFEYMQKVGKSLNDTELKFLNEINEYKLVDFELIGGNQLGNFYLTFEGRFLVSYYLFNEDTSFEDDLKIKWIFKK